MRQKHKDPHKQDSDTTNKSATMEKRQKRRGARVPPLTSFAFACLASGPPRAASVLRFDMGGRTLDGKEGEDGPVIAPTAKLYLFQIFIFLPLLFSLVFGTFFFIFMPSFLPYMQSNGIKTSALRSATRISRFCDSYALKHKFIFFSVFM